MDLLQEAVIVPTFQNEILPGETAPTADQNLTHILELDKRSKSLKSSVHSLIDQFEKGQSNSLAYFEATDAKVMKINLTIGLKPASFEEKFESPNLWLTLGSVAEEVTRLSQSYQAEFSKGQT